MNKTQFRKGLANANKELRLNNKLGSPKLEQAPTPTTVNSNEMYHQHDPFAKINPRARKVIENAERSRVGSTGGTGGSSNQQVNEDQNATLNFYSAQKSSRDPVSRQGTSNGYAMPLPQNPISIQIPGQTPRANVTPSYQNYLF